MDDERTASINEVVDAMNAIVQRDGGAVELISDPSTAHVVELRYRAGHNDDCETTCSIPPEVLRTFVVEGLRSHNVEFEDVRVDATVDASAPA